jgi:sporulation protein YlmC with PRC-barrel domain
MSTNLAYFVALGAARGGLALAQTAGDGSPKPSTVNQPVHKPSAPSVCQGQGRQAAGQFQGGATGDAFVIKQASTQWRAARLVGLTVYSADNKKVGAIEDILIGRDGAARLVVIGVGRFLGFGSKDVGVPFGSIQWRTETRAGAIGRAAGEASRGYPDKALLNVTLAQLLSAPAFHYAAGPAAHLESESATGRAAP